MGVANETIKTNSKLGTEGQDQDEEQLEKKWF